MKALPPVTTAQSDVHTVTSESDVMGPEAGFGRRTPNRRDALVVRLKWKTEYYPPDTTVERRANRIDLRGNDWQVSYDDSSVLAITRIEDGNPTSMPPAPVAMGREPHVICAYTGKRRAAGRTRIAQACCDSTVRDCSGNSSGGNLWNAAGDPSAGCPGSCSGAIFGSVFCFVGPCSTDAVGNGTGTIAFYFDGQTCDYDFDAGQIDCSAEDFNFLSDIVPPNVTTDFTYSMSTSVATIYCGPGSATKTTTLFSVWKGVAPDGTLQYGDAVQRYIPPGASTHAVSNPGFFPNVTVSSYFLAQPLPLPVATCNGDHARLIY